MLPISISVCCTDIATYMLYIGNQLTMQLFHGAINFIQWTLDFSFRTFVIKVAVNRKLRKNVEYLMHCILCMQPNTSVYNVSRCRATILLLTWLIS